MAPSPRPPLPGDCEATCSNGNRVDSPGVHLLGLVRQNGQPQSRLAGLGILISLCGRGALQLGVCLLRFLNLARGRAPKRARARFPAAPHNSRSPPARSAAAGQAASRPQSTRVPSRVGLPVEPDTASLLRAPDLHPAFLFALFFRRTLANNCSAAASVLANISHPCPPTSAPRRWVKHESSHTVGNYWRCEVPRCL